MTTGHTRRDFIRSLAGATAGAGVLLRSGLWAHAADASRVVVARHSGIISPDGERDQAAMEALVDRTMAELTGGKDAVAAWRTLFEPTDVVGLKVNCLGAYGLSTHPTLVAVIADRLQKAGLPAENIIVWERSDRELIQSGFEVNRDGPGVRCFGTEDALTDEMTQGEWHGRVTRIITDQITALINMPILKDHNVTGVTLALKNHFGSFDRPGQFHGNGADPFIGDVNLLPVIRQKQRLILADATVGCYEGGPSYNPQFLFEPHALMASTDPVAIDYQAWQIIESARKENGLVPLEAQGRYPKYLDTAAAKGLGTNDPSSIELKEVEVG